MQPTDTASSTSAPVTAKGTPVVQARGLVKAFGGVRVVNNVPVEVRAGEVLALMGENGAGKSTVLKILAGVHKADGGEITVGGQHTELGSVQAAQRLGIALIHQEPLSFPDLTVAENIFLGHGRSEGPVVRWRQMYDEARRLLTELGVSLDPAQKVRGLSIADQQMVELAAALSQKARVLLMDEPTAALTPEEVGELFRITRRLKEQGVAIVFISHRLEEVFAIADRITVLRDGEYVGTKLASETSPEELIRMMVGRPLEAMYEKPADAPPPGEVMLKLENLSSPGRFEDVSLEVRRGEIVGLAGLVGAGRTDVAQAVFGIHPISSGRVFVAGQPVDIRSPGQAVARRIAYVPEDRAQHGVLLPFSIASNVGMANFDKTSKLGWLTGRKERELAASWRDRLRIRSRDVRQSARELSGGNQQKVVLGKWLETGPDVLILDEPTRGIDVGAKAEVHHLMAELAKAGKAILVISSDLPEVLGVSDRVLVMKEGRLTGQFSRAQATQENVMAAATGQHGGVAGTRSSLATAPSIRRKTSDARSKRLYKFRELGILVFVVAVFLGAGLYEPRFWHPDNLRSIALYIPLIVVIAMGQMMVIVSRNIDLSVGSMLALSAMVAGMLFRDAPEVPLWAACATGVAVGTALGALNGVLVAFLRVPSIIATLGTLSAYRGIAFLLSNGRQVDNNDIPVPLISLSQNGPLNLPWLVWIAAAISLIAHLFLKYVRTGREVYAIGSNPAAAQLRGIKVRFDLFLIFVLSGLVSGIGGILFASRFGYVNPGSTGRGFELDVISAAVIGGTNVFGGSGTVMGTVLGCLLLGVVNTALPVVGVSGFYQLALYGLAILIAASVDTVLFRKE